MKVKLAESLGFCPGIRRAIAAAQANPGAVIAGGEILHNPLETARLAREYGISTAENPDNIGPGATAIIRAHGLPKSVEGRLRGRVANVTDATCPFVKRVQNLVSRLDAEGFRIIIYGDAEHPEVRGLASYARDPIIAMSPADLPSEMPRKAALVSQTTKSRAGFEEFAEALRATVGELSAHNTVCPASTANQAAVEKLAREADVVVIVGGKNSSNSRQLVETAAKYCDAYLAESKNDVDKAWFCGKKLCGLGAGASTPDYAIDAIKRKIEETNA
ncbi:MAG: 4-hydroxy-3-methylbut-2-enyl diphosphate reductase [Rickettsiales bacterium]|jgi:4-hydroxy-3-methylbut-2-enyl diphosphate reductase|nr:4-hydroxy-3-methylbut-2-enyl diphosphate reductase [Rickettsiales bacterium]